LLLDGLANGDFPSVKILQVRSITISLLRLVTSPLSSVTELCDNALSGVSRDELYTALANPHSKIRKCMSVGGVNIASEVHHIMAVHNVRDQLFVLTRRFSRDVLRHLAPYLLQRND
jgi:hypothetical protein